MKKNYMIFKEGQQIGIAYDVVLDPSFIKSSDLEYVEIPEGLEPNIVMMNEKGEIIEDQIRKEEREKRLEAQAFAKDLLSDPDSLLELKSLLLERAQK